MSSPPTSKKCGCAKGRWTAREDAQLLRLVDMYGAKGWIRIASLMKGRSNKSCRSRYHQHLAPTINSDPITLEEGTLIIKLVEEIGKQWAEIARRLPRRTDSAVKNWWYTARKRDCRIEQRLERIDGVRKVMQKDWEEVTKGSPESQSHSTRPILRINTGVECSAKPQIQVDSPHHQPQHPEGQLAIKYQQQHQYLEQNYLQNSLQRFSFPQKHVLPAAQISGDSVQLMSFSSLQNYSSPPSPWVAFQYAAPKPHHPFATTSESRFTPGTRSPNVSRVSSHRSNLDVNPKTLAISSKKQSPDSSLPATSLWSIPSAGSIHPQEVARRLHTYRESIAGLSQRHYEQYGRFHIPDAPLGSRKNGQINEAVPARG